MEIFRGQDTPTSIRRWVCTVLACGAVMLAFACSDSSSSDPSGDVSSTSGNSTSSQIIPLGDTQVPTMAALPDGGYQTVPALPPTINPLAGSGNYREAESECAYISGSIELEEGGFLVPADERQYFSGEIRLEKDAYGGEYSGSIELEEGGFLIPTDERHIFLVRFLVIVPIDPS